MQIVRKIFKNFNPILNQLFEENPIFKISVTRDISLLTGDYLYINSSLLGFNQFFVNFSKLLVVGLDDFYVFLSIFYSKNGPILDFFDPGVKRSKNLDILLKRRIRKPF